MRSSRQTAFKPPPLAQPPALTVPCRQERIEASGPLGCAPSTNPHLNVVEGELAAAAAGGLSDGFTLYLAALLEIERYRTKRREEWEGPGQGLGEG